MTFLYKIGVRPVVKGIVNVTPEFFSDGGRFVAVEAALAHERSAMHRCDIIDVGARVDASRGGSGGGRRGTCPDRASPAPSTC